MESENGCVIWRIANFSFCPQKCGQSLESPDFRSRNINGSALWFLRLYPRGTLCDNHISFFICRHKVDEGEYEIEAAYSIHILSPDGKLLEIKFGNEGYKFCNEGYKFCNEGYKFCKGDSFGFHRLADRDDVFKQKDLYLPNDTFKIHVNFSGDFLFCHETYLLTVVEIEQYCILWKVKENMVNSNEITFFGKHKFVITGNLKDRILKINAEAINVERFTGVIKCKLILSQRHKIVRVLKECESFFDGILNILPNSRDFTFSMPEHIALPFRLLDEFQLRCELLISHDGCEERKISDNPLFRDFLLMYTTEKMTDVTLRVDEQLFQAHKFVLSARSPVFSAMFEKDMIEKQNGVVDLKELDAETLKDFLHYLYGGTLQKLDKESARKLLFVADRYLVTSLKDICSYFLVHNITEETVGEYLILADMIKDDNLREAAIYFFVTHAKDVLESSEWKQFQDNYPKLATEALTKFALDACSKLSV